MTDTGMILVAMAVTSAALTVVFAVAWESLGKPRHALTWSVTFAFATLQWSCNLARDLLPSFPIHWALANLVFPSDVRLTASYGVSVAHVGDDGLDDLLRRADTAMYRCKRAGRNRVDFEGADEIVTASS